MPLYIIYELPILLCFGVNTIVAQELVTCPDGYIKHHLSCYKFHHVELSWPEARTFCGAFDSHLLQMETAEEHAYIGKKIQEIASSFPLDGFWIGLTDAVEQGTWKWSETNEPLTYNPWFPGEPQDRTGEDCAGISKREHYKVADYYCGRNINHVICEIDLVNTPTIVG